MIERITTAAEFRALRGEWEQLYCDCRSSNVFLTHAWLSAWTTHMAGSFAVLCRRPRPGAPLDAAAIFATDHHNRWCYVTEHSYLPGILCAPDGEAEALRAFLLYIFSHEPLVWRVVLHRCLSTADFHRMLDRALGALRFLWVPRGAVVPSRIIDTAVSFDDYLAQRPSKVRQEIRRKRRRIVQQIPGVTFAELPPTASSADALDIVAHVEEDSWKRSADTAIISHRRERDFYSAVFELGHNNNDNGDSGGPRGRLFSLTDDSGAIAYVLGVEYQRVFFALKTSYRADHARHAPGQVLFFDLIEHFCQSEQQLDAIELLGTDSRWKRELATRTREEHTFEIMRPGAIGLPYTVAQGYLRPKMREAAARDPHMARLWQLAKRIKSTALSISSTISSMTNSTSHGISKDRSNPR